MDMAVVDIHEVRPSRDEVRQILGISDLKVQMKYLVIAEWEIAACKQESWFVEELKKVDSK
jgi:hypothetical protein